MTASEPRDAVDLRNKADDMYEHWRAAQDAKAGYGSYTSNMRRRIKQLRAQADRLEAALDAQVHP